METSDENYYSTYGWTHFNKNFNAHDIHLIFFFFFFLGNQKILLPTYDLIGGFLVTSWTSWPPWWIPSRIINTKATKWKDIDQYINEFLIFLRRESFSLFYLDYSYKWSSSKSNHFWKHAQKKRKTERDLTYQLLIQGLFQRNHTSLGYHPLPTALVVSSFIYNFRGVRYNFVCACVHLRMHVCV